MSCEIAVVVLAAGAGRRLGGLPKALLRIDGEAGGEAAAEAAAGTTFLERIAGTAAQAGAGRGVVVVGPPHGERVAAEARRLGLDVADNPAPERGMGSSVAIGFAHAAARFGEAQAALLWPVDHARVAPVTAARLVEEAGAAAHDAILVPVWRGRGGHPTSFGRAVWPDLLACAGLPRGARSVLAMRAGSVRRLELGDPAILSDVDRPGDLG